MNLESYWEVKYHGEAHIIKGVKPLATLETTPGLGTSTDNHSSFPRQVAEIQTLIFKPSSLRDSHLRAEVRNAMGLGVGNSNDHTDPGSQPASCTRSAEAL